MRLLRSIGLLAAAFLSLAGLSDADAVSQQNYPAGYDISFPQCNFHLPTPPAFAVVGLNGGVAGTRNKCFQKELTWAESASGTARLPGVSIYVNTGNPGHKSPKWPRSNRDKLAGYSVADRYGKCTGNNSLACGWQYGWNIAEVDAFRRGITQPQSYSWWLDVETENSWQHNKLLNRAVLTGMTDYFDSIGAVVGIYSSWLQFPEIAGIVGQKSPLFSLPEWVTGSSNQTHAKTFCFTGQFMAGGDVMLSQYYDSSSSFDSDLACPESTFRKLRSSY